MLLRKYDFELMNTFVDNNGKQKDMKDMNLSKTDIQTMDQQALA